MMFPRCFGKCCASLLEQHAFNSGTIQFGLATGMATISAEHFAFQQVCSLCVIVASVLRQLAGAARSGFL